MKKSFYLQQFHSIMQMGDSLIILLLGISSGFTTILYKTKRQPPLLRDVPSYNKQFNIWEDTLLLW